MRLTIRTRLTLVYCLVFCLSAVALEAGAYWSLTSAVNALVDRDLHSRLAGIEDFLNAHIAKYPLPKVQSELRTHFALQPELLAIADEQGRWIFRSSAMDGSLEVAHHYVKIWTGEGQGRPMRLMAARRTVRAKAYDVHLATDLTVPFGIMHHFRLLALLSAPIVLLCASMAGYWISWRAMMPVAGLTKAARHISAADLSERLAVPAGDDEIHDLAVTLNGMLARIEDAFRHITQFTANASHELRTPLALIRTTAEVALLRTNGNADTYREALHRILREAEKNTTLLDDMMRLARADSTARRLRLQHVDLGNNIRQACERVDLLALEKGIGLTVKIPDAPLPVCADADHLLRLWLILLDNAIKYTPAGGEVAISAATGASGYFICDVSDSGIGIAEEDLPHIFERFFRADKARTREAGGAGLGLSIAKWIAEAHNAAIQVESAVGSGSRFRVVIPGAHDVPSDKEAIAPNHGQLTEHIQR